MILTLLLLYGIFLLFLLFFIFTVGIQYYHVVSETDSGINCMSSFFVELGATRPFGWRQLIAVLRLASPTVVLGETLEDPLGT